MPDESSALRRTRLLTWDLTTGQGRRVLMVVAMIGVLAYVVVAVETDAGKLLSALAKLGWGGCTAVLGLSAVNYVVRFARWQYYIAGLGHRLGMGRHFLVYLSGFAMTVSPAKGGEAVRSLYMRDHGVPYAESIAALFVERLVDFLAMILLSGLIVSAIGSSYIRPLLLALTGVLLVLIALGKSFVADLLSKWAGRRRGGLARVLSGVSKLLKSSQRLLQPGAVLIGLLLALVAWGAEGIGFYMILQGLQLKATISAATGIYAISSLAGAAAFFMPGGIGGMEVVMTSILVLGGAPLPVAVVATLLCRLATLWFAVVIGIAATMILEAWPAASGNARAA